MENTHISWTDHTFNPWEGCTKVSPGCLHCYAETRNQRFSAGANWGKGAPRRRTSPSNWKGPLKWNAAGIAFGIRPRVFCASLADWLDDEVPVEWLADLLDLVRECKNLDWLLLTKRPENFRSRMEAVCEIDGDSLAWSWLAGNAPVNIWIGATVEDQTRADERIPVLLSIPAVVRFLSCEPLLGSLNINTALRCPKCGYTKSDAAQLMDHFICGGNGVTAIDWVICGGESGPSARPMHPDWARSLRDQCKAAGVPFHFKQWGEWVKYIDRDKEDTDWRQSYAAMSGSKTFQFLNLKGGCGFHGERFHVMQRVGKLAAGRKLDGIEHLEFPEVSK